MHPAPFWCHLWHFYPRPPWGGRLPNPAIHPGASPYFYPRPPWGGRPRVVSRHGFQHGISIHALRGEGDLCRGWQYIWRSISIHALRGEGDVRQLRHLQLLKTISIHALRGEGDAPRPARDRKRWYFYPRPPWGGRLANIVKCRPPQNRISIHALRGEGDPQSAAPTAGRNNFYPRPPWGGRRRRVRGHATGKRISIHALRGEGDARNSPALCAALVFLSTPSVGRATAPWYFVDAGDVFLSTPSVGRATPKPAIPSAFLLISIHALRGEGDDTITAARNKTTDFYPRPPWGGRPLPYVPMAAQP